MIYCLMQCCYAAAAAALPCTCADTVNVSMEVVFVCACECVCANVWCSSKSECYVKPSMEGCTHLAEEMVHEPID